MTKIVKFWRLPDFWKIIRGIFLITEFSLIQKYCLFLLVETGHRYMYKKYFFLLLIFVIPLTTKAQVFTKVHTSLKGVMQPVMSWLDVYNNHYPDAFVAGDYYVSNKHFVISQLTASLRNQRFGLLSTPFPALYRGDAAVADYDKDGDQDIVMTGLNAFNQPVMRLYRNDGHRHFTFIPQSFTPLSDGSIEWGDFDHDGDLDILVTGKRSDNKLVTTIYRNNKGVFTEYPIQVPGVYNGVARWGDYDHDGDLDILITGNDGNGPFTAIYINERGKYYLLKQHFVQLQNSDARWADFDGDGDLDFIISGEDKDGFPDCRIYSNEKNGLFVNIPVSIRSLKSCSIDVADYDHDGDPDIVMTGESMERPYTEVYENELGFEFKRIVTGIPGVSSGKAQWGDYDHDGDMDLLVSGITVCYDFISEVYRNNLNPKMTETKQTPIQPIPVYNHGPYYYYVFSSCYCDPSGGTNAKYHLYISNIHKEKSAYNLNYKFNELLIKTVPNWGKSDRGHRTSNAFSTIKEAETSRMQVIESYKATGFEVHFLNW
jgi:predicted nucleotidyltransferase